MRRGRRGSRVVPSRAMRVEVRESVDVAAAAETLFGFLASEAGFLCFPGFGPIPGLERVVFDHGTYTLVGSESRVTNTDGSTHRERIVECERPRRFTVRIVELSGPFGWLVREIEERWELHPSGGGSHLERVFAFTLRSPLYWPLSLLLAQVLFRAAMRRHHRAIAARFDDRQG